MYQISGRRILSDVTGVEGDLLFVDGTKVPIEIEQSIQASKLSMIEIRHLVSMSIGEIIDSNVSPPPKLARLLFLLGRNIVERGVDRLKCLHQHCEADRVHDG